MSAVIEVTGKASWGRSSPLCHQEEVCELSPQSCLERALSAPPAVEAAAGGVQGGPQAFHLLLPTGYAQDWRSTKLCNPYPSITVPSSGKRKHRDSLFPGDPTSAQEVSKHCQELNTALYPVILYTSDIFLIFTCSQV